jgi:hypothetical protein
MGSLNKYLLLVFTIAMSVMGCQQRMACPAYHSYFILDVSETKKQFSLFGPDSLPKENWEVAKQKVGIAEEVAYNQKWDDIRTISMESIYIPLEDPFAQYQPQFAEADSLVSIDSLAILTDYYDDFENVDQMIYLYHFGKYLNRRNIPGFDPKEEMVEEQEPLIDASFQEGDETTKEKKKLWPFGKKKNKKRDQENTGEEE